MYVSFRQSNHLWENLRNVQILHLVPFSGRFLQNMHPVGSFTRLAVMHDVRHQIVRRIFMLSFDFWCEEFPEIDIPSKGKIHWVFSCIDFFQVNFNIENIKVNFQIKNIKVNFNNGNMNIKKFTYLTGKFTIVGFFSTKNVFFVKRLI